MRELKICAIIVAGGKGKRMTVNIPKQFIKVDGIPILIRTLHPFESSEEIDNIILVLPEKWKKKGEKLLKTYRIKKVIKIVNAGRTRQASVYNGLITFKKYNPRIVVIHDGARPFITEKIIKESCDGAVKCGAVSAAISLRDTVFDKKRGLILERKNIIRIQTPQAFRYSLILNAHIKARRRKYDFPDDTSLLLYYGTQTSFIDGDERNIKITDKKDLLLAQAIVQDGFSF